MPRSLLDLITKYNETDDEETRSAFMESIKSRIQLYGWHAVIPHLHWLLR